MDFTYLVLQSNYVKSPLAEGRFADQVAKKQPKKGY